MWECSGMESMAPPFMCWQRGFAHHALPFPHYCSLSAQLHVSGLIPCVGLLSHCGFIEGHHRSEEETRHDKGEEKQNKN